MVKINIGGSTYEVKNGLKTIGCKWDSVDKVWYATSKEMADQAEMIVNRYNNTDMSLVLEQLYSIGVSDLAIDKLMAAFEAGKDLSLLKFRSEESKREVLAAFSL